MLTALIVVSPALADTTVSGGSTAVKTSTAASGSPDNISQTGTLSVTTGSAITIDSSNTVTNSGTIQVQDVDNVVGVEALGGNTGAITNSGAITLNDSATTTTTDSAGDVIGAFAKGANRTGIKISGPGAFTGSITNSGSITIQGTDSTAISVTAPLVGAINNAGTISVTGGGAAGLRTGATVSGAISVTGGITAIGPGAQAINLGGDVGGGLAISSAVSATGYHTASRPTASNQLTDLNQNDNAQGGAAVQVQGSLGGGLLVAAPPATLSTTVTDVNGDGLADATETEGTVTSYGSAPAILVGGAAGHNINLGLVGTGDSANGVVIEGVVTGTGLRDGIAANGLQLGVAGGGAVAVAGGIHVTGQITTSAFGASATSLHLLSGASAPLLFNSGSITADVTGDAPAVSQAVVVEAGASLPEILNSGTIQAISEGSNGPATAISDQAGSLTHLENVGVINAQNVAPTGSAVTPTGVGIAIDDAANTTGFSLRNYQAAGLTTAPAIIGAIRMGSGADTIDTEAGTITGDLSFGAGDNALNISGGSSVVGGVTATGGTLAINIGAGSLQINNAGKLNVSSLSLASGSSTIFTVDPAAGQATELDVSGAANIADGAKIGVRLTSIQNGSATYALVRSNQFSAGVIDETLLASTPYLYTSQLAVDQAGGTLSVTLARKTATQLGLPGSIANAYEPVIAAVAQDPTLSTALLGQTTRASFMSSYQQLLPEHSGGIFQMISEGTEAFGRPLDDRQGGGDGGAWGQEVNFYARAGNNGDLTGYNAWGIGLVGGYELPAMRAGVFGVTFGGFSGELRPHDSADATQAVANLLELGGYWRTRIGPIALNARVAGDYLMAKSHRGTNFTAAGAATDTNEATGHWNGWGFNSRLRASYERRFGDLYLRPQGGLDVLQLNEGSYQESGGGVLDLAVDKRKTTQISGFAGVAAGAIFGDDASWWGPEVLVGYRDAFSTSNGATTARFLAGGDAFTVDPNPVGKGGVVARVAIKSEAGSAGFSLEAGGEQRDHLTVVDAKIAAHFSF